MLLHFSNVLISIMFSLFHSFILLWYAYGRECSMGYIRKPEGNLWEFHPVGPWDWTRLSGLAAIGSTHCTILSALTFYFKKKILLALSLSRSYSTSYLPSNLGKWLVGWRNLSECFHWEWRIGGEDGAGQVPATQAWGPQGPTWKSGVPACVTPVLERWRHEQLCLVPTGCPV